MRRRPAPWQQFYGHVLGQGTVGASVCSASVRKSLQGLDYISSAGAEAFDDLCDVVQRLGNSFMGMSWAKEQSERLRAAKRYLKRYFKVRSSPG